MNTRQSPVFMAKSNQVDYVLTIIAIFFSLEDKLLYKPIRILAWKEF